MALTLITGVPGTGKTAFIVSELEKIAATGRKIFVDNIPGLQIEHYRAGKVTEWHKGTWLHVDQYKRTSPAVAMSGASVDDDGDDGDGNENWIPNPEVVKDKDGFLHRLAFDQQGNVVGSVPYESHKGALLVIDECQRHFRPRPQGSAVPDHVAALEVHRHQGLDIWLITQRPGLVDSNVRALCGKHIALRSTPLGRYKYEWPEVGDIDSRASRDTAARTRYKLPKHVFKLYKSAEAHTKHKHTLPFAAKALLLVIPLAIFLFYNSYKTISGKFKSPQVAQVEPVRQQPQQTGGNIHRADYKPQQPAQYHQIQNKPLATVLPPGFEPYSAKEIDNRHPFDRNQFRIVGRITSSSQDVFTFSVIENGQHTFYMSSKELQQAGYDVLGITDCSAKIVYKTVEFFVTCNIPYAVQNSWAPDLALPIVREEIKHEGIQLQPYP